MKNFLSTVVAAFLAGKAGCGCLSTIWALLFFLVVGPISIVFFPYETTVWVFKFMLVIELIFVAGSVFL